jgi:hypothetical protein
MTQTTTTRSAPVPRGIFCVPVARWQQATVCVGVWAGRQIASGFVVSRSATRRREYGMLHLPSHFSFFSLTTIIGIILIITEVMNAEDLTRNISRSYLASPWFQSGNLHLTAYFPRTHCALHFTAVISHRQNRNTMYQLEHLGAANTPLYN